MRIEIRPTETVNGKGFDVFIMNERNEGWCPSQYWDLGLEWAINQAKVSATFFSCEVWKDGKKV